MERPRPVSLRSRRMASHRLKKTQPRFLETAPPNKVHIMGMGTTDIPPRTAKEWNSGSCDIMAVALHRMYGLPLMAEFEWGIDEQTGEDALGYLCHAWVRLPDGQALDAGGPRPMFEQVEGGDPDDPWVKGYRILELRDDDPHLLDIREEDDYVESIEVTDANGWIRKHLAPILAELGIHPCAASAPVEEFSIAGARP